MKNRRFILRRFSNLKFRSKMLLSYTFLIILPLLIFSLVTFNKFSKIIEKQTIFSTVKNFEQTFSYLTEKIDKIEKISDIAITNNNFYGVFEIDKKEKDVFEFYRYIDNLMRTFKSYEDKDDISRVIVYVPGGNSISDYGYNVRDMNIVKDKKWYQEMLASGKKIFWVPNSYFDLTPDATVLREPILSTVRQVYDPDNYTNVIGILRVDFKQKNISDILSRSIALKGSLTYIQNSKDELVACSDTSLYEAYKVDISKLSKDSVSSGNMATIKMGDQKLFYLVTQFEDTDWYLTTVIPASKIFSEKKAMWRYVILLMVIALSIAFILAGYMAYSMTKRIYKLNDKMKDVQNGKLDAILPTDDQDEIGELTNTYNYMLEEISQLIADRYQAGLEVKSAELKALQAQINPHFLYNTLDMISWMAKSKDAPDVVQAIDSLATFYKFGLSKGREQVKITSELSHVASYVEIQNMRFQNKLNLIIDVDEEIKEYYVLKLTLQPIVENAILHGIMKKKEREGTILIEGRMVNDCIVISIHDDGIGMSQEQMEKVIGMKLEDQSLSGYGISNIIQRIKLFYGERYGLIYHNSYNGGTIVEIRIPPRENPYEGDLNA